MSNEKYCRLTNVQTPLNLSEFSRLACARCYELLFFVFYPESFLEYEVENGVLYKVLDYQGRDSNKRNLSLIKEDDVNVLKDSLRPFEFRKWKECCESAVKCCKTMISSRPRPNTCSPTWDGWSCHSATARGQISTPKCPDYIYRSTCNNINGYFYFLKKF